MSDRDKPARCPNRGCKKPHLAETNDDWISVFVECGGCDMKGPAVDFDDRWERDRQLAARAEAVRLWNALPREAGPAGVARGEL